MCMHLFTCPSPLALPFLFCFEIKSLFVILATLEVIM